VEDAVPSGDEDSVILHFVWGVEKFVAGLRIGAGFWIAGMQILRLAALPQDVGQLNWTLLKVEIEQLRCGDSEALMDHPFIASI
jgi:hypothetical protein